jgi:integrase/recombinase XerC
MDLLKRFEAYLEKTDRSSSALFYVLDLHKFAQWFERRHGSFDPTARRILTNYLATFSDEPDFLFASRFCRTATEQLCQSHLSSRGVQHLVKRYAERAKLDRVSPHTLRHSFCKNLIDAGVSLDKVALLAGHSSLDVTRRYTTPSLHDLQEAVEYLAWE